MDLPVYLIETFFRVHKNLYMVLREAPTIEAFLLLIVILNLKY